MGHPAEDLPESEVIQTKLSCDDCGSSDAKALYDDGHTYCFSCSKWRPGEADSASVQSTTTSSPKGDWYPHGAEALAVTSRKLDQKTCQKWGYLQGYFNSKGAQFAIYRNDTGPVAAKVRLAGKEFLTIGDMKKAQLYGQHLWSSGQRKLVITEGEIDAMSLSQAQDHKYPVVSIPTGAASAKKAIQKAYDWVDSFDEVVLWFDNDEPGKAAAKECAALFKPGKCKVVRGELKDANEYLKAGRIKDMIDLTWRAEEFRPDGIVRVADVKAKAMTEHKVSYPWFLDEITQLTLGRRLGEAYALGAGTGVGKTDFLVQQIDYDTRILKERVGLILLEQDPSETVVRVAGKRAGKLFHIPLSQNDGDYTLEEKQAASTLR